MAGIAGQDDRFEAGISNRPGQVTSVTLPSGETFSIRVVGRWKHKRSLLNLPRGAKLKTSKVLTNAGGSATK